MKTIFLTLDYLFLRLAKYNPPVTAIKASPATTAALDAFSPVLGS
ncbi:hypothetical protein HMPREF1042_1935 [Streptococcus constellatus subsp. pharyngis SK1060 = CCUG 46377]|uniref:Uncharacterized protein n=1 Tax=Streptococcus constellatus subsp. pharyngis SK1060 = CCUG 46377 TaxID=1035184 RepID=F9P7S2_STRCV|nr:hypothetical protein HMPREF1042_1935 [Streptococcus constellatus subsp. pharyngis SK1060 = CCUG 46377]